MSGRIVIYVVIFLYLNPCPARCRGSTLCRASLMSSLIGMYIGRAEMSGRGLRHMVEA